MFLRCKGTKNFSNMQILGCEMVKKKPKYNFGEMDGVRCPNIFGRNERNLMSK